VVSSFAFTRDYGGPQHRDESGFDFCVLQCGCRLGEVVTERTMNVLLRCCNMFSSPLCPAVVFSFQDFLIKFYMYFLSRAFPAG
jgi:hypothetical protein